ncbi:MAG: hypothetical protein CVU11_05215 [Bacteroidetes bacterium HGW-Bacteroidetes-6]|nr:MAG: hypothetical protein CVU11_05215 [Bacteroidetes bacterium HGW-Bacteroidetes-6]
MKTINAQKYNLYFEYWACSNRFFLWVRAFSEVIKWFDISIYMKDVKIIAILQTIDQQAWYRFWERIMIVIRKQNNVSFSFALVDATGEDFLFRILNNNQYDFLKEIHVLAPKVNLKNCKMCTACIKKCNADVLTFNKKEKTVTVYPENCVDCGKCYKSCKQKNTISRNEYKMGLVEGFMIAEGLLVYRLTFKSKKIMRKQGLEIVLSRMTNNSVLLLALNQEYAGKKITEQADCVFDPSKGGDVEELMRLFV